MGGFVKYVNHFLMETQIIELLLGKPAKLGEHPSARFSDPLYSNGHELSVKKKAML